MYRGIYASYLRLILGIWSVVVVYSFFIFF